MLARRALVGVLLCLTAIAFVLLFVEARGSRAVVGSSSTRAESVERGAAELAAPAGGAAAREQEPQPLEASAPSDPPLGESAPVLARLTGVLLLSSDRRPVAGAQLVFDFDTDVAEVVTDELGRFTTGPVVPSGLVRAWHADVPTQKPYGVHLEIEPAQFLVPDPTGPAPMHELELLLMEPEAWLEVQVVANGAPVPALVTWHCSVNPPGPSMWQRATDPSGRLRIPLTSIAAGAEVELSAHAEKARSRTVTVVYPWKEEVVRLELEPVGAIHAHVHDEAGRALRGESVRAEETQDGRTISLGYHSTDDEGQAVLETLSTGPVEVFARDSAAQKVWVPAGGVVEVEFVLGPRDVLVAGRVVDENGQPLRKVTVEVVSNRGGGGLQTEADGSFSRLRDADDDTTLEHVSVGGGADEDRYEPEEVDVPPGTTGLLFRRLPPSASVEVVFALLDAHTLAPLDGRVFRYRASHPEDYPERTRDGLVTTSLKPADDVRILCRVLGYRERTFDWPALPEDARAGKPFRALLEPGFEQCLRVRDEETDEPLVGARVFEGDPLVATTDGDGLARVTLSAWPAPLRVTADGHAEGTGTAANHSTSSTVGCGSRSRSDARAHPSRTCRDER